MDIDKLKQVLLEQEKYESKEEYVQRELQLEIDKYKDNSLIIVISGIRRCGKSTLLKHLKSEKNYYVNFDDERLVDFTVEDFETLKTVLIELFGNRNIFIFDEIQNIDKWELFVRRLHNFNKKVYVTGSNASMMSRELGTRLTGRHITFSLYPFSFKEFLYFNKKSFDLKFGTSEDFGEIKKIFNEYVEKGGFPESLKINKNEYLESIYENIIYKDIITRYKLTNTKVIKEVVLYAASNVGKEISFNEIRKAVNLSSTTTVKEYFEYLENSYLAFLVAKYDYSLKKQIYSNKKLYFIDTAMIKVLGFRSSEDYGRILENVVFLHLKRQNKKIYFHKENFECDFIIRKGLKITEAIQVTKNLSSKNKDREINGLVEAMKKHKLKKGLILTEDAEEELIQDGMKIMIKPIWKWLLEDFE